MNIEEFRSFCLSLPGVCEKMPFDKAASDYDRNLMVFTVGEKWFCLVNIEVFDFCTLKLDPERARELQNAQPGIRPGWHMNKRHWISADLNGDVPDSMIRDLLRASHACTLASLPRKIRTALETAPRQEELPSSSGRE